MTYKREIADLASRGDIDGLAELVEEAAGTTADEDRPPRTDYGGRRVTYVQDPENRMRRITLTEYRKRYGSKGYQGKLSNKQKP